MKRFTKKWLAILMTFAMVLSLMAGIPAYEASAEEATAKAKDIVVLYTNDIHCAIEDSDTTDKTNIIGYDGLAAYKKELVAAGKDVTLVDVGDFVQGGAIGTLSKGEYIIDIMNYVGYDLVTPGNHEFDYGMDQFNKLVGKSSFKFVSSNFMDLNTDKPVFKGYEIIDYDGVEVAYVGISTPESITKSTPTYFQDSAGNYIYGFKQGNNGQDLYAAVQAQIDAAKGAGADYVVALAHLGIDSQSKPWTSYEVIANTTGIDVMLDGHSHSLIEKEIVKDKNQEEVILSSTSTAFKAMGELTITTDGKLSTRLISDYTKKDAETTAFIKEIKSQYEETLNKVVAKSDFDLVTYDPATKKRLVRSGETNLGDLCADAYRTLLGADIAFVNGGGIRADILKGDITYGEIINVHPFGNMACLIEATGQQILDALEFGSKDYPNENGGFLHVSGLTYEINSYIPSSVKMDAQKMFISVEGDYRVKNVMVAGKPLDVNKIYTLASHNFMLKNSGDGYTMFKGNKILQNEVLIDNQVLINYIVDELGGTVGKEYSNPYGQGRITVKTFFNKEELQEEVTSAGTLKEADYTAESWKAYQQALTAAKAALANEKVTQAEVDTALAALKTAKTALVKAPVAAPVNKEALKKEIAAEKTLKEKDYTQTTWKAYQDALKAAVAVDADPNATQAQVDTALTKLQTTKKALVAANKGDNPKTGDTANLSFYAILGVASIVGVIFLTKKEEKRGA
ncbi:5'-nucleotidase C-terminal domain-containing protein [Alloiococcus sp. CFN-8]|uniref:5'-nucleotidase C-terminal domain-containing protein n=1 Tax=Alloiococcus sp. CFN-8 TaxID=3416081 RepID=UPI003CF5EE97